MTSTETIATEREIAADYALMVTDFTNETQNLARDLFEHDLNTGMVYTEGWHSLSRQQQLGYLTRATETIEAI